MLDVLSVLFGVVTVGVTISVFFVARFVYQRMIASEEDDDEEEIYEHRYICELEDLKELNSEGREDYPLDYFEKKEVEDKTPCGIVNMRYNSDDSSFEYYSESRNIPYKYLDTVARLYVISYNCPEIYIDMYDELAKAKTKHEEEKTKEFISQQEEHVNEEETKELREKDVFAKYKSYNTKAKTTKENPNYKENKDGSVLYLKERTNKFKFLGKMHEKKNNKNENKEGKDMSFQMFQEMLKNKTEEKNIEMREIDKPNNENEKTEKKLDELLD